jgi:transcriptional activator SPT7
MHISCLNTSHIKYHPVIVNPIDLQTMLKKVKSKQYKSKRKFVDDLDLI